MVLAGAVELVVDEGELVVDDVELVVGFAGATVDAGVWPSGAFGVVEGSVDCFPLLP